jgi:hypothetical protein
MNDFARSTRNALARKGIFLLGPVAIPDTSSSMPWANASRGYAVSDNDCYRILTHAQVLQAAQGAV